MDATFIQIHITGQEKIFLLIWIRDYKWQPLTARLQTRETESPTWATTTSILHLWIVSSQAKGKLGKNRKVLQGTKGCRLKHKFWKQWTIVLLLSILSYAFNVPRGSLYSFFKGILKGRIRAISRHMERPGVKWVKSMSRKTPKGFGLCTHPNVHGFSGQTHVYTRL